jgi:hypothetical protein
MLSAAVNTYGTDYEKAIEWQRIAVGDNAGTIRTLLIAPTLLTDRGSAFLNPATYRSDMASGKIVDFARAVGAGYVIVCTAQMEGRKDSSFFIQGTDGARANEIFFYRRERRFGSPEITMHEANRPPWESDFLGPIARALRELRMEDHP